MAQNALKVARPDSVIKIVHDLHDLVRERNLIVKQLQCWVLDVYAFVLFFPFRIFAPPLLENWILTLRLAYNAINPPLILSYNLLIKKKKRDKK